MNVRIRQFQNWETNETRLVAIRRDDDGARYGAGWSVQRERLDDLIKKYGRLAAKQYLSAIKKIMVRHLADEEEKYRFWLSEGHAVRFWGRPMFWSNGLDRLRKTA